MPTSAIIILIIVVWLFVLAPWLLRSQRPVSHIGDGFDDTRVLYSGGSGSLPASRRPRLRARNVHAEDVETSFEDVEYVAAEDDVVEDDVEYVSAEEVVELDAVEEVETEGAQSEDGSFAVSSRLRQAAAKARAAIARPIEGEVVEESEGADDGDNSVSAEADDDILLDEPKAELRQETADQESEVFTAPVIDHTDDDAYELDETYLSPVDLLYPGAVDSLPEPDADEHAEGEDGDAVDAADAVDNADAEVVEEASDTELSAEEIAFAQARKGRGGWDPVAENVARKTRFQKRQRTLFILVAVLVAAVAVGIVAGGWAWAGAAVLGVVFVCYLIALRNLTLAEHKLYRRRVAQLRRARLGVRNAHDEELAIPRKLRHPGAVVLEADDASPDFEFLPLYDGQDDVQPRIINRRDMPDDLSDRRVS